MTDSRWEEIWILFEEGGALPEEERSAFLKDHCKEEALREEVASLLSAAKKAPRVFNDLSDELVTPILDEVQNAEESTSRQERFNRLLELDGRKVGRYVVEERLGGGGMGVVYKARDSELERPVALKILPPHLWDHPEAEERFVREAKAAAALQHTHIATVYEIGETEEVGGARGSHFIAMAYYEGETLKEKLDRRGELPIGEALRYAEQIATALGRAHEAGVLHRDVKPANVMVTRRAEVKLLDFGLARIADQSSLTKPGRRLGTAVYMSPEQVRGEDVGPPTDLWAFGVLLYEMVAGERPFRGERETAVLQGVLHEEPEPVSKCREEVGPKLEQVVHRCLEKDPDKRYPSAEGLLRDLRALGSRRRDALPNVSTSGKFKAGPSWRGGLIAAAMFLLLVFGTAIGWRLWLGGPAKDSASVPTESPGTSEPSIAVLPFQVSGAGSKTWGDGMVTVLSAGLDGTPGLRAIADRTVLSAFERTDTPQSKPVQADSSEVGEPISPDLEIAQDLGAKYAVIGSTVILGSELRLVAGVHETGSGRRLGRAEVRGAPDSIMALADELARQVLRVLLRRNEVEEIPTVDLKSLTTHSLPALKSYLKGEGHLRAGEYEAAIEGYEGATYHDTSFALAFARLADSRALSGRSKGWHRPRRRAYQLSDQLPPRVRRLVRAQYIWEIENRTIAAADSLRLLAEVYPDDPRVWYELGEVLFHGYIPGGWPEAEKAFYQATRLNPDVAPYHHHLVDLSMSFRHDATQADRRIAAHPEGPRRRIYQEFWDLNFGSPDRRRSAWSHLDTLSLPDTRFPYWIRRALSHPKDLELQGRVLSRLAEREDTDRKAFAVYQAINRFRRGRVEEALPLLQELPDWASPKCRLAASMSLGYSIPDSTLRGSLAPSNIGSRASPYRLVCAGIYLIEDGRGDDLSEIISRIREAVSNASKHKREAEERAQVAINELRGYKAWRTGSLERASQLWSTSKPPFWQWGSLWRGDVFRELGKRQKAEDWYQAGWIHPVAHERLGQLYEELGEAEKAVAAYRRFAQAWAEADAPLQTRVEGARKRIQALGGEGADE